MADIDYFELSKSTLEELAEKGDTQAMLALGINLYYGIYDRIDVDNAWDWLSKAYTKGEAKASAFLGEMIYFRQVEIKGFDSDDQYVNKAYEFYKEAAELDMIAGYKGLCKMIMRNDYPGRDGDEILDKLEEMKDEDEESQYLYDLIQGGDYSPEDINPSNEFGLDDEEDEDDEYEDEDDEYEDDEDEDDEDESEDGMIRRWLSRDVPEEAETELSLSLDDILGTLDEPIADDLDDSEFEFYERFYGETLRDLLLDVIKSDDEAVEMLVALSKYYRFQPGEDIRYAAYWAHKAVILVEKGLESGKIDDSNFKPMAYGELGNVYYSYSYDPDLDFPNVEKAAKYYEIAAKTDYSYSYDYNTNGAIALASMAELYKAMDIADLGWSNGINRAWCGQVQYFRGYAQTAAKYWNDALGKSKGWGEYFMGRYCYMRGETSKAYQLWREGASEGSKECELELANRILSDPSTSWAEIQKQWEIMDRMYRNDETPAVYKYIYKFYMDKSFKIDMTEDERRLVAYGALDKGIRRFCPYCAKINYDELDDRHIKPAIEAWGYDGYEF